jgi:hypothetical protein
MKKSNLFLFCAGMALLASCGTGEVKYEEARLEGVCTVSIPGFLKKVEGLVDGASLEFQNPYREFYVAIINEPKEDALPAIASYAVEDSPVASALDGYTKLVVRNFESAATRSKVEVSDAEVNGLKAQMANMTGNVDVDVFFLTGVIEGKQHFHQIITWTLARRKGKHKPIMEAIIRSFREIENDSEFEHVDEALEEAISQIIEEEDPFETNFSYPGLSLKEAYARFILEATVPANHLRPELPSDGTEYHSVKDGEDVQVAYSFGSDRQCAIEMSGPEVTVRIEFDERTDGTDVVVRYDWD